MTTRVWSASGDGVRGSVGHVSEKCVRFGLRLIKAATQERTDRARSQLPPLDKVVAPLACAAIAGLMAQNALNQVQRVL